MNMMSLCRPVAILLFATLANVGQAEQIALPGHAYPESVTSTADGTIYVSNISQGGILRIRNGRVEQWIQPGSYGTRSIYGVVADERAGVLWACSNDLKAYGLTGVGDPGVAIKAFDLHTGLGRKSVSFGDGPAECNDIAVAANGDIYITDTEQPRVMRLAKGASQLETWVTDPRFQHKDGGLDGIAFGDDGNLYVNTLGGSHLFRIEVRSVSPGAVTQLTLSIPLEGTDGMRHESGTTFLVVDGAGRLNRVAVVGDQAEVTTLREGLNGPTGVTIAGHTAWVTEGQFSTLLKTDAAPSLPFRLQAVDLRNR